MKTSFVAHQKIISPLPTFEQCLLGFPVHVVRMLIILAVIKVKQGNHLFTKWVFFTGMFLLAFSGFVIALPEHQGLENHNGSIQLSDTASISRAIHQVIKLNSSNADEAFEKLNEISLASQRIGFGQGVGEAFFQKGDLEYRLNHYQPALRNFDSANEIAGRIKDTLLMARSLERMASVNLAVGDDHLSLKLYYESLPLFQAVNNKKGIAAVYNIIGLYKSAQHEYDSAEAYYRKAIQLNNEAGSTTGIVHNKGNLGYMYEKTGEYHKAAGLYHELVGMLTESGDSINLPVIYYNLSSLHQKQKNNDSVLYYLRLAQKIALPKRDTSLLSTLYGDYGNLMVQFDRSDSAYFYLQKAATFARAIGEYNNELNALNALLDLDTMHGNYKRAASYFKRIGIVRDTIASRKIRNNLRASELGYENQQQKSNIELKQLQLQAANRKKRDYLFLSVIAFVAGLLLILVIVLMIKNFRKRQALLKESLKLKDLKLNFAEKNKELSELKMKQAQHQVAVMNREQISNSLALEQKTQLLNKTHKKLSDAIADSGNLKQEDINQIVSSIKSQLLDASEVDLFNQKFNELHSDFFDKLKNAHPALTNSELKFCAYLKLNLNGSQIAKIQNVSNEAIRKSRYRIRKKLALESHESLEGYLSGI